MSLTSRLRVAREAAGMVQAEVSRLTGIAVPNLSKIESGTVDIRLSTFARVLDALGLEVRLVPRGANLSIDDVMSWSQQGWARLAEVGLGPSRPQERLDAKRSEGIDVSTEQSILNAGV